MVDTVFWVMAIVLMLGGLITFNLIKKDEKKELIRREIKRAGGSVVEMSNGPGGDRSTFAFRVRFQDQEGQFYTTYCKVHVSSNQLYWTQNPAYLIEHFSGFTDIHLDSEGKYYPFSDSGLNLNEDGMKEMVVNSLTSSYRYERQAMAKRLAEQEVVDDVFLQLLQDMAVGDEDEEVRETAVATLKALNKQA